MLKPPLLIAAFVITVAAIVVLRRAPAGKIAEPAGTPAPAPVTPAPVETSTEKPSGPAASEVFAAGLVKAKAESKRMFLDFGYPACGWCRRLDKFHADKDVAAILEKYYVIVKIDTELTSGGQAMYDNYAKGGAPFWVIFDAAGSVIINSDDGSGNVGYPNRPNEWAHYEKALKTATPKISDDEIATLLTKLKQYGTSHP